MIDLKDQLNAIALEAKAAVEAELAAEQQHSAELQEECDTLNTVFDFLEMPPMDEILKYIEQ